MSLIPIELTRDSFKGLLEFNSKQQKHTILKLTADWCRPCKTIKDLAIQEVANLSTKEHPIECYEVNVDDSLDFYAFMKQKRMVNGIPVFLFYKANNTEYIPDDSITGANPPDIVAFFARCAKVSVNLTPK
jgi:thiol:disulfide interchange protein